MWRRVSDTASLDALYQEEILHHYRHPHGRGILDLADATATARNPACGEELSVAVRFAAGAHRERGPEARIAAVRFTGQACSLATASASMMTDLARGARAGDLTALGDRLAALLRGPHGAVHAPDGTTDGLGPLRAFGAVRRVPARISCVLLPWEALRAALGQVEPLG